MVFMKIFILKDNFGLKKSYICIGVLFVLKIYLINIL